MIEIAIGASILGGLTWLLNGAKGLVNPPPTTADGLPPDAMAQPAELIPVDLTLPNGSKETWLVARDYIGPIGINEAKTLAESLGFTLPTPALVDAIWRQADLKLLPMPRNNVISQAVFDDQKNKIQAQIAGRGFQLLGGSFKDVVNGGRAKPDIYGWHVEDGKTVPGIPLLNPVTPGPGKIIQPFSGGAHDLNSPIGYKDYSQGLRLVKRA